MKELARGVQFDSILIAEKERRDDSSSLRIRNKRISKSLFAHRILL